MQRYVRDMKCDPRMAAAADMFVCADWLIHISEIVWVGMLTLLIDIKIFWTMWRYNGLHFTLQVCRASPGLGLRPLYDCCNRYACLCWLIYSFLCNCLRWCVDTAHLDHHLVHYLATLWFALQCVSMHRCVPDRTCAPSMAAAVEMFVWPYWFIQFSVICLR